MHSTRLRFNYKDCIDDLNIIVAEYPSIPQINEDCEKVSVEGRTGDLYIKKGTYQDRTLKFKFIQISNDLDVNFDSIYEWLTNIEDNRLYYDREDIHYVVKRIEIGDLKREMQKVGSFEVSFICKTFRETDEIVFNYNSKNRSFYNSGKFKTNPTVMITGSGDIDLTFNDETFKIKNLEETIIIDSELMSCVDSEGNSLLSNTYGNFPIIEKGTNTISVSGTVTELKVIYREMWR